MVLDFFKQKTLAKDEMYLHDKKVKITKITPVKWKALFSTIDNLPGLIVSVVSAPAGDVYEYALHAFDMALDEILNVVSVLTDVDVKYLEENVGLSEIADYLVAVVELNRLDTIVKKAKSLYPTK